MGYLATTRGAILRGTTTDALGDEIDANGGTPLIGFVDMPVGLVETSKDVYVPATGTRRTVRKLIARVDPRYVPLEGDRLRDNRTGTIYAIDEHVAVPRSLAGQSSLTLDLRKLGEA